MACKEGRAESARLRGCDHGCGKRTDSRPWQGFAGMKTPPKLTNVSYIEQFKILPKMVLKAHARVRQKS
jgi:hypothetical protein